MRTLAALLVALALLSAPARAEGLAGTFQDATALRVNYFRAMAGVSAAVTFSDALGAKAQQAALMMSANNSLSHFPPTTWLDYTQAGAEAARL